MVEKENSKLKEYIETFYYPLKDLNKRTYKETTSRERNPFQRDYSRILYSNYFRRLQGKMQLLGIQSDKFFRNRLTHSLEVSQIARSIAENISNKVNLKEDVYKDDIYVVEAGSLAHDLGNPPFGHHGERVLNEIMENEGGFEGNAQTFRILHKLEMKLPQNPGLNLTFRTLLSTVKYNSPHKISIDEKRDKNFLYQEDYEFLNEKIKVCNVFPRTIDVQIVDLADEIAYAAHDLEDALSLKLFNIDEFMFEFKRKCNEKLVNDTLKELVSKARDFASLATNYNSSEEFSFLFRKELTSNLVNKLICDIDIVEVSNDNKTKTGTAHRDELGFRTLESLAKMLKKTTLKLIYRTNEVHLYEKQGEKIIRGLFNMFENENFNKDNQLLPAEYRIIAQEDTRRRAITDYIAGMMDSFAIKLFTDYYGQKAIEKIYDSDYFGSGTK